MSSLGKRSLSYPADDQGVLKFPGYLIIRRGVDYVFFQDQEYTARPLDTGPTRTTIANAGTSQLHGRLDGESNDKRRAS